MAGLIKLQSDVVRTGDKAYQFVAENGIAYLTENVSGDFVRIGFGFHYRAADWTEQPSYGAVVRQNRMMTSATTPAPSRVTVSGEHVVYPGWKAFNGDSSTGWWTSGEPQWLAYDHGSPMPVSRYKLRAFTEGTFKSHIPNNFELQGSTDGVNWITVDTQTNRNPTVNNTPSTSANDMTITMPQTHVYRHWRLYVSDTPSNSVGTGDLELWGGAITIPVLPIAQVCAADGTIRATLQLDSQTHHLQVVNSAGTLLAETTRVFDPDNWYYLEWSHGLSGGELRFNGVTEITWNNTVTTVEQLRLGLVTTKTAGFFMDDIIVSTGEDWPGPVRCHLLQPNEDIEETGWSRLPADAPTAHSMLTDGDDASYLYSQQGVIRVGLEDLPDENEILAVQMMSRLSVDAEGETDVDFLLDETIIDTQTLTTTPTWYTHLAPVNPATDAAWTAEDVNALGVGWMMVVVPDAPANLTATNGSTDPTDIDVAFDPPSYTGGADIIEYEAEVTAPDTQTIGTYAYQHTSSPMTGLSTPTPLVASASSVWSDTTFAAWHAFTTTTQANSDWCSVSSGGMPQWVQIDFGAKRACNSYQVSNGNRYGGDEPKAWTLSGSDDGTTWTVVDTRSNQTWPQSVNNWKSFTLSQVYQYRYWRWTVTAVAGSYLHTGGRCNLNVAPIIGNPGTTETQVGASSPITFLAKPYDATYDVRARARNLKGWGAWTLPISYLHQMPFSPTDIAGLFGWWAADNPDSTASSWRDSSGNNRHIQANAGPYSLADHEGKPAWLFTATTQMFLMTPTARPAAGNLTVFIVCKPTQSSNVSGMLHQLYGSSTRYDWWWGIANGSSMFDMRPNAATGTTRWTASNSGYASRNVHVIRTANGSPNRLFLGTTAVGSGASANYGAGNAADRLYVGGTLPGGGAGWTGYIYELLIYHATLSDADVTAIRDWLITKHNL